MSKPLRQKMPTVAAWIDELREAFGQEMIDTAIRAGINGQQAFHASEGGESIGTEFDSAPSVTLAETVVGRMFAGKARA